MCGFFGYFMTGDAGFDIDEDRSAAIGRILAPRGPDGCGERRGARFYLRHHRLALNDLSPAGDQPFTSTDGAIHVAVNGEISNARSLRDRIAWPFTPPGHSDSLAVFDAYAGAETDFPRLLRGMFAAVLVDERRKRLVLTRDRFGEKPVFWFEDDRGIAFASSPTALLPLLRNPSLDPTAVALYLIHGAVPPPHSLIAGIKALEPGTSLVHEGGGSRLHRYFDPAAPGSPSGVEIAERIDESIRLSFQAEAPVGLFLSGGLDSAAILESIVRQTGRPPRTYSIGFRDAPDDERPRARDLARRFGAKHTEVEQPCPRLRDVMDLVAHLGEPIGDASALPLHSLALAAAKDVKAVVTGDGGDELFMGYDRYVAVAAASRPSVRLALKLARPLFSGRRRRKLEHLIGGDESSPARRLLLTQSAAAARAIAELTPNVMQDVMEGERRRYDHLWSRFDGLSLMQRTMLVDRLTSLEVSLVSKTDRATMAAGVEARSPFLDHLLYADVFARMQRSPSWPGPGKRFLRRHLGGRVPTNVLLRKKRGFGTPLPSWFGDQEFMGEVRDLLLDEDSTNRGVAATDAVERLLVGAVANEGLEAELAWSLLILECWCRRFLPGASLPR